MTVGELLRRVTSRELTAWKIYFNEEPFGYDMENWRFAMLAAVLSAPYRKKKDRRLKINEFLPQRKPQPTDEADERGIIGDPL